jgi:hypothetical protein
MIGEKTKGGSNEAHWRAARFIMMTAAGDEFDELKSFLGFFFDRHMAGPATPPEVHPLKVLEDIQRRAPKRVLEGLRMAINDCIEMTAPWPLEKVAALDAELRANGLLTLTAIRRRYSRSLHTILKRGRIRSEVEYYLVRGAIEDPEITADQATIMQRLLAAFEESL